MTDKAKKPSQFVELQINKESVTHQELKEESCCGSCSGKEIVKTMVIKNITITLNSRLQRDQNAHFKISYEMLPLRK
ncbi:MAG: hypothetical protein IPL98_04130 [Saprospiraceae bacterium]|nr:hypothetical protein [Saprospiraceae bacterium]